ncbi:MAG: S9 family peptidase [Phycisphaerae bacterium]
MCIALGACLAAAQPIERTHDITIDDYFTLGYIEECAISPDGAHVAYVEKRWEPPAEGRNADLWIVDAKTQARRRVTFDPCGDSGPQWSPDGKSVYFVSSPKREGEKSPPLDGKKQVWRFTLGGDAPQPVTRIPGGIDAYDLSHDGRAIYYLKSREHGEDAFRELRDKYKDHAKTSAGQRQVGEIWKLDLESWITEKLVDEKRFITHFDVSPDQKQIALITTPDERLITNEGWSRVDVLDVASKKITSPPDKLWRADAPSPHGWLEGLAWSSDSQLLAFAVGFDGYPSEIFVVGDLAAATPKTQRLKRPDECYTTGHFEWVVGAHDLLIIGDLRARQLVYRINGITPETHGQSQRVTPDSIVVDTFAASADAKSLAIVGNGLTSTNDVLLIDLRDTQRVTRLTNVNPQVASWKLPQISIVDWPAPDGMRVEGILELPHGYEPGKPLPLIVELHGGPTWSTKFRFEHTIYGRTAFPAKGYALFSPNYRGSTGYGDKFLTDLIGRENDIDVQDILSGVNALIQRGIADEKKMAVMGWSNGGFLTNCVITHDPRFKAASSGAGMVDQIIQWGIQDTPGHNYNYMRGLPWAAADAYRAASPLYGMAKVQTPTLIHFGENDERVPVQHGHTLFRALQDYRKIPTQLVVYPGEGHGLSKYSTRKAKMEWDAAWFDKYLTGEGQ